MGFSSVVKHAVMEVIRVFKSAVLLKLAEVEVIVALKCCSSQTYYNGIYWSFQERCTVLVKHAIIEVMYWDS